MFLFPKGALTHHFVVAKSALRDPREAVVSLPLVGLVRSAEGYPLLAGSTGYAAIHPPDSGGYTCRKNTGKFSGRILQPEMAACENLPPAAFLQRNMETTMFLYSTALFTGRR